LFVAHAEIVLDRLDEFANGAETTVADAILSEVGKKPLH